MHCTVWTLRTPAMCSAQTAACWQTSCCRSTAPLCWWRPLAAMCATPASAEVCSPQLCCCQQCARQRGHPAGESISRDRLFRHCSWEPVSISEAQWQRLETLRQQQAFLGACLRLRGASAADVSPASAAAAEWSTSIAVAPAVVSFVAYHDSCCCHGMLQQQQLQLCVIGSASTCSCACWHTRQQHLAPCSCF